MKALPSRTEIVRCNSSGPLYPLRLPPARSFVVKASSPLWHRRLGHPGHKVLSKVASTVPFCNKELSSICHACQLGRHTRLPFQSSDSRASSNFDLIQSDLWTSPIASVSGYKYYLLILDNYSPFIDVPFALQV